MLYINSEYLIEPHELQWSFSKGGGSGGQKINKTNSQVTLHWNLKNSSAFPENIKNEIIQKLSNQLTKEGALVFTSQNGRSQGLNRQDCLEKLQEVLQKALYREKVRKATRPSKGSKEKRLKEKKAKGNIKRDRQNKNWE